LLKRKGKLTDESGSGEKGGKKGCSSHELRGKGKKKTSIWWPRKPLWREKGGGGGGSRISKISYDERGVGRRGIPWN